MGKRRNTGCHFAFIAGYRSVTTRQIVRGTDDRLEEEEVDLGKGRSSLPSENSKFVLAHGGMVALFLMISAGGLPLAFDHICEANVNQFWRHRDSDLRQCWTKTTRSCSYHE